MRWSKVRRKKMQLCESQKKEDTSAPNVREVAKCCVFLKWFVCWVSRKVGSLKRRVRSHVVRGAMKNCTPLWREAHFQVKMYKICQLRSTFWSCDVEKLRAAVARSAFSCENVQNMSGSDYFLMLRCWKIARRCGEKDIFKWKCTKHVMSGPLFEVEMSKNCTPLWREAHFQVKMLKNWRSRSNFWSWDVEKLHAAVAPSTFWSENVQNTCVLPHFLKFRCRKISQLVS